MAPRSQPSERQRRLGAELRKLRVSAGLAGDRAAALLRADRARISNIEAGRIDVSGERLAALLRAYGCPAGPLYDGLMALAHTSGKGWWDEHRDAVPRRARDLAEAESRATSIRVHETAVFPCLLQTEEYARAFLLSCEESCEHIDRAVRFTLTRQRLLTAEDAPAYHAVIHESALRVRVGSVTTMRRQLLRVIEWSLLSNVTVQFFPYSAGPYFAGRRPFTLFGGSTAGLDTLYQERAEGVAFSGNGDAITRHAAMFTRLSGLALDPLAPAPDPIPRPAPDSLGLLRHALYEWA